MPKSGKKKKEKASDFAKAKLKLGKGKKPAINATDISFKAKAISLPTQNIGAVRREDEVTTRRNQTFAQVRSRLRHYSPAVRKNSLYGLKEILRQTGTDSDEMLSQVFEACGRLVGDEDTLVRRALIDTFRWIISSTPTPKLEAHVPLLLLHVLSNMAHIFPEIRIDAMRVLQSLLDRVPAAVVLNLNRTQSVGRVLDAFRSFLQIKRRSTGDHVIGSTSNFILTASTKIEVLACMRSYLNAMSISASAASTRTSPWYLRNASDSQESFDAFQKCLPPSAAPIVEWKDTEPHLLDEWLPYNQLPSASLLFVHESHDSSVSNSMMEGTQPTDLLQEGEEDYTSALADMSRVREEDSESISAPFSFSSSLSN